jgi:hypothetical protein
VISRRRSPLLAFKGTLGNSYCTLIAPRFILLVLACENFSISPRHAHPYSRTKDQSCSFPRCYGPEFVAKELRYWLAKVRDSIAISTPTLLRNLKQSATVFSGENTRLDSGDRCHGRLGKQLPERFDQAVRVAATILPARIDLHPRIIELKTFAASI